MVWTVRVFRDQDRLTHTDSAFATKEEAYAMLFTDPLPLPSETPTHNTDVFRPYGFAIYNDVGIVEHAHPAEIVGTELN